MKIFIIRSLCNLFIIKYTGHRLMIVPYRKGIPDIFHSLFKILSK